MSTSLRYNEGMVIDNLHVSPGGGDSVGGEESEDLNVLGIGDTDKGRSSGHSDDGVILISVVPSPDIVTTGAAVM